jgi:hypothetical protein
MNTTASTNVGHDVLTTAIARTSRPAAVPRGREPCDVQAPDWIDLDDDVIVVHSRDSLEARRLGEVASAVKAVGAKPVVVADGAVGHQRLFARIIGQGHRNRIIEMARGLRLDVDQGPCAVRVPLHPTSTCVRPILIEPATICLAVDALCVGAQEETLVGAAGQKRAAL